MDNVYVLASAFLDGESIVPVKLEIKEFPDKENTLYVAIALESIKKNQIVKQEVAEKGVAQQYSPSFNISIAKFFGKINPNDSAHRVLLPDGSEFGFSNEKNAEPTVAGVKGENRRQGPAISSASNISILDSGEKINPKEENGGIFVYSYSAERTEEFSTRRTLLAVVNTRKGANGELFIDSIPDSGEKSNPSEENSSQEVGEAQFSLAKSEDGKAYPYTKRGAEIVRGLAVEKTGITLNRQEAEALDDSIYFAANIAYPGGIEASADAAAAAALTELRFVK